MTSCTLSERTESDGSEMVEIVLTVPPAVGAVHADVVGEFMAWVPHEMFRQRDGSFIARLRLEAGRNWAFRFLIDGERYINDWDAPDYVQVGDDIMSVLRT